MILNKRRHELKEKFACQTIIGCESAEKDGSIAMENVQNVPKRI